VPVLDHEPARDKPEEPDARLVDDVCKPEPAGEHCDCDTELPFVDPPPEHAHARAELMAFEADH
jgi:hypothetical protein